MNEIVKVCAYHGELTANKTYIRKISNKQYFYCKKCLQQNSWRKRNPEKDRNNIQKRKEKYLIQLQDKPLVKICINHGNIPIDRIRINSRGELVCRICVNEQRKKSRDNDPNHKEKVHKWLYSDRERINKYRKQDKPNRLKRQKKRWHTKKK